MSNLAIRVDNVGKRFRIGVKEEQYRSLRTALTDAVTAPFRRAAAVMQGRASQASDEEIWALRNISFEIKKGEVVGIIGGNGAGKSTLLKILSRITEPSEGRIGINGRVGSLLEVGTGFHAELTGRENIHLNGAILGMRRAEIARKFDEIIAFAELDKFLDTPVKHYSSGMYMRLAFAVAAHLETEILIVDEVLAVGDAAFQKKCLGKMNTVAKAGRTVLFVSHNMGAIMQLCTKAIILDQGRLRNQGPCREVTKEYLASMVRQDKMDLRNEKRRSGDGRLRFVAAYLRDEKGERTELPVAGHAVDVVLEFEAQEELTQVQFMLTIFNHVGVAVTHCNMDAEGKRFRVPAGRGHVTCRIPKLPLPHGQYKISAVAADHIERLDSVPTACAFDVESSDFYTTAFMPAIEHSTALVEHSWSFSGPNGQH